MPGIGNAALRLFNEEAEIFMNVLLYAAKHTDSAARLKHSLQQTESLESLTDCWDMHQLVEVLQTPDPLPEAVILQAESREDLQTFASFRFRLDQVFFILILPNADRETVACGHKLRPRFIAYQDSDFSEIEAVLERIEARQEKNGTDFLLPLF